MVGRTCGGLLAWFFVLRAKLGYFTIETKKYAEKIQTICPFWLFHAMDEPLQGCGTCFFAMRNGSFEDAKKAVRGREMVRLEIWGETFLNLVEVRP